MKRLIIGSLSFLILSGATVPAVLAGNENGTLGSLAHISDYTNRITPSNLVSLAYRGYFQQQGIPSYVTLVSAHQMGTINAQELVEAGVNANRLSSQLLTDPSYLSAVEFALENLTSR
ncbi:MAG TPA: hypothetical protein DDZ80_09760 [Cyanobacteria bacterium UBA8803]|nr:hypothetical protein [Cyanobacteria bacterium UBA9273]HBL58779.1 hypothetical protein [Cyanobacteria bacterium UBA8803]